MSKSQTIFLVLTACVVVGGDICRPKALVEVSQAEARDLLHRRKARLATEDDLPEGVSLNGGQDSDDEGEQNAGNAPAGSETGAADTGAPDDQEKAPAGAKSGRTGKK